MDFRVEPGAAVGFAAMISITGIAARHFWLGSRRNASSLAERMAQRGPLPPINAVVDEPNEKERGLPPHVAEAHAIAVKGGNETYTDPDTGLTVFTRQAHLNRGRCCGSHCRHCPYAHANVPGQKRLSVQQSTKSKVYTKTGDRGTSSLFTGERRRKTDPVFEALGTIDELNSFIGVAIATINDEQHTRTRSVLESIQRYLLDAGSIVATPDKNKSTDLGFTPAAWTATLESEIDQMDESLPPLDQFILPGGSVSSAHLHVCRSVCRRAERAVIAVRESEANANTKLFIDTQRFLNRLSDYLFVAARFTNTTPEKRRS